MEEKTDTFEEWQQKVINYIKEKDKKYFISNRRMLFNQFVEGGWQGHKPQGNQKFHI